MADGGVKIWDIPFSFVLEIDGIQCGSFQQIDGLGWQTQPQTFREGGRNTHDVKLMGPSGYKPLKLKKGFMASTVSMNENSRKPSSS